MSTQTTESVLSRFDHETRIHVLKIINQQPQPGTPIRADLLQSFAEFLYFQPESSAEPPKASQSTLSPDSSRDTATSAQTRTRNHDVNQQQLSFDSIMDLDDQSLDTLLRIASPDLTISALACSPHQFVVRVLSRLTPQEANMVTHKINTVSQINLDELTDTQTRFTNFANELLIAGLIELPNANKDSRKT